MTWKDYFKTFLTNSVDLRGVAAGRAMPIFRNVENVCIMYQFWYQINFE